MIPNTAPPFPIENQSLFILISCKSVNFVKIEECHNNKYIVSNFFARSRKVKIAFSVKVEYDRKTNRMESKRLL